MTFSASLCPTPSLTIKRFVVEQRCFCNFRSYECMVPEHALQVAEASPVCAKLNLTWRTAGSRKELGNKLGLLIESLSIKRTAPSSSCSRSLKVIVCWICCCLFMVSHIDVRPACYRACVHARFACSDLLACVLDWLTVSQHVHLFPRCSAPCRILNLFRNTPLHRPLHMECCPVSFVPPKKYCAADVGSALPMAARTHSCTHSCRPIKLTSATRNSINAFPLATCRLASGTSCSWLDEAWGSKKK